MSSRFISHLADVQKKLDDLIRQRVTRVAIRYERIWQESIREGNSTLATARQYERLGGLRNTEYARSQPGSPPAIQTGALVKGITHKIEKVGSQSWSVAIGESQESGRGSPQGDSGRSIAEMLEFGTSKMEPRPSWLPALIKLRGEVAADLKKED